MLSQTTLNRLKHKSQIQRALYTLKNNDFTSTRAAATFFKVSHATLARRRLAGQTRTQSNEMRQILTNAEEKVLVRWIGQYTKAGTYITNTMLVDLALRVRAARVTFALSNNTPNFLPPLYTKINPK